MTKNAYIGPNFAVLRPKFLFFGEGTKVLVLTYQKTNEAPGSHCFFGRAEHQYGPEQGGSSCAKARRQEPLPKSLDSDENSNPFDFSFPSYSSFCKKKTANTLKSLPQPSPTQPNCGGTVRQ